MTHIPTKSKNLTFRMEEREYKELKEAAAKCKTRVSNLLRLAVSNLLVNLELNEKETT